MDRHATRRAVLGTIAGGAVVGLAGCTRRTDTPAGTLGFVNAAPLPHSVTVRVEAVGTDPGEEPGTVVGDAGVSTDQRTLTATVSLDPGEEVTYETAFNTTAWYLVDFEVDGQRPPADRRRVRFSPAPEDGRPPGRWLRVVLSGGDFDWQVVGTDDTSGLTD